jgi:hypothetical protein
MELFLEDPLSLGRGWYEAERGRRRTFRWAGPRAEIELNGADSGVIALYAGSPDSGRKVSFELDGEDIGHLLIMRGWFFLCIPFVKGTCLILNGDPIASRDSDARIRTLQVSQIFQSDMDIKEPRSYSVIDDAYKVCLYKNKKS